jgi:hypothetical protein
MEGGRRRRRAAFRIYQKYLIRTFKRLLKPFMHRFLGNKHEKKKVAYHSNINMTHPMINKLDNTDRIFFSNINKIKKKEL